jgi:hypothetical protein
VQATEYFPYLQTGQLKGLLAGGRAAAEYENLLVKRGILKETGSATLGLGAQSMALFTILIFIITGNIGYFFKKRLPPDENLPGSALLSGAKSEAEHE